MFDIAPTELLIVALVALVVIGPKDLPRVMRTVGNWVGKAKGMARHFRSGLDTMMREAELEEMERKWKEENARIMREFPSVEVPKSDAAPLAGESVSILKSNLAGSLNFGSTFSLFPFSCSWSIYTDVRSRLWLTSVAALSGESSTSSTIAWLSE